MSPTAEPQAMTTAGLQAKVRLRGAWFEAHPNQPIPEARAEVETLFAAIEDEARSSSPDAADAGLREAAQGLLAAHDSAGPANAEAETLRAALAQSPVAPAATAEPDRAEAILRVKDPVRLYAGALAEIDRLRAVIRDGEVAPAATGPLPELRPDYLARQRVVKLLIAARPYTGKGDTVIDSAVKWADEFLHPDTHGSEEAPR